MREQRTISLASSPRAYASATMPEISDAYLRHFGGPVSLSSVLARDGPHLPSSGHEHHSPPRMRDGYHASRQAIVVEGMAYHRASLLTGFVDRIGLLRHDESCAVPLAISTSAAVHPPRRAVGLTHP
jgi:hypothetical protein